MKIKLLIILALFGFAASAQTKYELNYDSVRVAKGTTSSVRLSGKIYIPNITIGLITDSVLVFRNNRVFKVPRSQFLSSYTEIDPTVPAYAKTLSGFSVIKESTDLLYEPFISPKNTAFNVNFGNASGTAAQGNDNRINNGQTAFGWGNHQIAGYYSASNLPPSQVQNSLSPSTTTQAPSVTAVNGGLATKENSIAATTSADYYRGDKIFAALNKAAVGLSNVDNTSDAGKPVSTAQQSALDLKENLSNKSTTLTSPNDTNYPTTKAVNDALQNFTVDGNDFQGVATPADPFRLKLVSVAKGGTNLSALPDGILKSSSNVITAATAADYVQPSRTIAGFPLSSNVTLASLTALNTSITLSAAYNGATARTIAVNLGNTWVWTGKHTFAIPTTSLASYNLPPGTAPTAFTNGDVWMTSLGEYHRVNGVTQKVAYSSDLLQVVEVSGTSQNMTANTLYIPHNVSLTTFPLPATATVGQLIQIVGEGAGGWRISQATSQQIVGVNVATTSGTTGYIQSTNANCTITLRYTNTNKWTITSSQGTLTIN